MWQPTFSARARWTGLASAKAFNRLMWVTSSGVVPRFFMSL